MFKLFHNVIVVEQMNKNMSWYVQKGEHVLKIMDEIYDGYKTYKDLRLSGALIFDMLKVLYLRHSPHAHNCIAT